MRLPKRIRKHSMQTKGDPENNNFTETKQQSSGLRSSEPIILSFTTRGLKACLLCPQARTPKSVKTATLQLRGANLEITYSAALQRIILRRLTESLIRPFGRAACKSTGS